MIYGKLSLKDWRTARVEGETPVRGEKRCVSKFGRSENI